MKKKNDLPKIVIVEGIDKSGKTTLISELNKRLKFSPIILDRFTTSSKVYNKAFSRNDLKYFEEVEKQLKENFEPLIILCIANKLDIQERLLSVGEALPKQLRNIDYIQSLFIEEVKSFDNVLILNTSKLNLKECVDKVLEKYQSINEKRG